MTVMAYIKYKYKLYIKTEETTVEQPKYTGDL
jgi:hypothetical protein